MYTFNYQITFKSTFEEVNTTVDSIMNFLKRQDMLLTLLQAKSDMWARLNLALRELFLNAVEHGNRMDVEKKVECKISCSENELKLCVQDEGEGFILGDCVPEDESCTLSLRGRGINIIKKMGFIIVVDKNCVMVTFKFYENN